MKKSSAILITFLFSIQLVSAQKIDTSVSSPRQAKYSLFMQKNRTNKIIAWSLLGAGTTMMVLGVNQGLRHLFEPDNHHGEALFYAGGGMAPVSIPFFISAGENKRRARLSLKGESTSVGGGGPNNFNYAAVSLKINFRHNYHHY